MKDSLKRRVIIAAGAAAVAVAGIGLLAGCGDDKVHGPGDTPHTSRPGVLLHADPPEGDASYFVVDLRWDSWDDDGAVDHFLYCVDPPESSGADSVWQTTQVDSIRLTFTEEALGGMDPYPPLATESARVSTGYHVFIVKAVDDLGAVSLPDYIAFNETTLCPRTDITSPPPQSEWDEPSQTVQSVGSHVTFRWSGEDPDGAGDAQPAGYGYKLADVTGETDYRKIAGEVRDDPKPWGLLGQEVKTLTLDLEVGHAYGFAVTAIDETGAVEPVLILSRNLIWVSVSQ